MRVFNQEQYVTNQKRKVWILGAVFVGLIALVFVGVKLIGEPQDIRNRAASPSCPVNGAVCKWMAIPGAIEYEYFIEKKTNNIWAPHEPTCSCPIITGIPSPTGGATKCGCRTAQTQVNFTSEIGGIYRCTVKVVANPQCQNIIQYSTELTCGLNVTPTITPTPTGKIGCYQPCSPEPTGPTNSATQCPSGLQCVRMPSCPTGALTGSPSTGPTGSNSGTCYWCYATSCQITPTVTPTVTPTKTPTSTPTQNPTPSITPIATVRPTQGGNVNNAADGMAALQQALDAAEAKLTEAVQITRTPPSPTPTVERKIVTPTTAALELKESSLPLKEDKPVKKTVSPEIKPSKIPQPTKAKPRVTSPPPKAGTLFNLLVIVGISVSIILFGLVL